MRTGCSPCACACCATGRRRSTPPRRRSSRCSERRTASPVVRRSAPGCTGWRSIPVTTMPGASAAAAPNRFPRATTPSTQGPAAPSTRSSCAPTSRPPWPPSPRSSVPPSSWPTSKASGCRPWPKRSGCPWARSSHGCSGGAGSSPKHSGTSEAPPTLKVTRAMHRFDPELVAALAEGTLEAAEAGALEAQIAADPAALADLAKQRAALAAIRTAGSPRLEDLERTTLRAAIAEQLGLAAADAPAAAPTRRVAWGAIAVAASALVAIVAFAPVVGLLSTGGSDDAGDLTFGDDATLVADEADAPLGASLPPGDDMETEAITTTAPATGATGNNEFP